LTSPTVPLALTVTGTCTAVPVAIPDSNATGVQVPVTVNASGTVGDVNANLSLTHTWDSDLIISLLAPDGTTTAVLANRRGSSGDNYTNTSFDDEAANPISSGTPPFTGSFRPDAPLTIFDGLSAPGTWNLKVADLAASDTGSVTSFNLTVTTVSCTLPAGDTFNYLPTIWR
jgi:serine protease